MLSLGTMRVLLDFQSFQSEDRSPSGIAEITAIVLALAKAQRAQGFELIVCFDPRRPFAETHLFRQLALWCVPRNVRPYPFPALGHTEGDGSDKGLALLVEQTWRHLNPDVILVADGRSVALDKQILPNAFATLGQCCWGALLVDADSDVPPDPMRTLREEARLLRYDFLVVPNAEVVTRLPASVRTASPAPVVWPAADRDQNSAAAFIERLESSRPKTTVPATQQQCPRPRLGLFAPTDTDHDPRTAFYRATLPFLGREFSIDVWRPEGQGASLSDDSPLAAQPSADFPSLANSYDVIAYAVSDAADCAPLIEYLQAFPGILILHESSFSKLFSSIEATTGAPDVCINEALFTDGTRARKLLAGGSTTPPAPASLCLGRTLFELSTGVIVFSPGQQLFLERRLGRAWPAPIAVVRHSVPPTPAERDSARRMLGFSEGEFVVVMPPSMFSDGDSGAEILAALADKAPPRVRVIALGVACPEASSPLVRRRVRFTGPLSPAQRALYGASADVALHTGCSDSGWAEQCLAMGVQLLCADKHSAAYFGGPTNALACDAPSAAGIARQVIAMAIAGQARDEDAIASRTEFVAHEHSAARAGDTLANALRTLGRLSGAASPVRIGERLAHIAREERLPDDGISEIAKAVMVTPMLPRFAPQRILIDVTNTSDREFVTGIERVVTEVTTRLCCLNRPALSVEPVTMRSGQLFEPTPWLFRQGLLRQEELPARTGGRPIVPEVGDVMLMIDSSWDRLSDFAPHYRSIQRGGGAVYTVVYDLLPLRLPECFEPGAQAWFARWLERAIPMSDGLICISKAVADDLIAYIAEADIVRKPSLRIGYWHLGSSFKARSLTTAPSERAALAAKSKPFMMVGTIEPRKRHALVLDAFEDCWRRGGNEELAIVGRAGWMVESLMNRLRHHDELGRRLHVIEGATDDELAYLYGSCRALIQASDNEGFGLPIIEAAQYGKPVILSDIPVFREIAGEHATYFRAGNRNDLARILADSWSCKIETDSSKIAWLSWDDSVAQLAEVILDQKWYKIID